MSARGHCPSARWPAAPSARSCARTASALPSSASASPCHTLGRLDMYRGLDLARDTYQGFKLRPVQARQPVQPVAAQPSFDEVLEPREDALEDRWHDRDAKVSSLVGTLP